MLSLRRENNMIVVRLYKLEDDGRKKYVSKVVTRNKHRTNNVQVNLTFDYAKAMVFKTTEELVQFQFYLTNGNHGVNASHLKMEYETIDKTFEEAFGVDPMDKAERVEKMNFLAKKDHLEAAIRSKDAELKNMNEIDLSELPDAHREEVSAVIATVTRERDLYFLQLQELLNSDN